MSLDAADEMEARNRAAATLYRSEVVSVHLFEDLGGELVEVPVTGIVHIERHDPLCNYPPGDWRISNHEGDE